MRVQVSGVDKVYASVEGTDVTALRGVDLAIESGQFVALVGPSGCGKTTLLDIVAGLSRATRGRVTLTPEEGEQVVRPGLVFQQPVLMPWRTALENVLLPTELGAHRGAKRERHAAYRDRAQELLELVGLKDFEGKYPDELSGGMQQRVAIARALLLETNLVLMDEPFSALDEFTREQMNLELLQIWQDRSFTTVFVTHNIFEAVFLSDRVVVMTPRPGKVVEDVTIELPRPRDQKMIGSDAFSAEVRKVRAALNNYWAEELV